MLFSAHRCMRFFCVFSSAGLALGLCLGLLAGCASNAQPDTVSGKVSNLLRPYRMEIIQGNVVTSEQIALLRPGLQRAEVRDILGTPLLASIFHANRWDYVFSIERADIAPQLRKVTVFFDNEVVARIESQDLPSESEFVSTLNSPAKSDKLPALEASEERLNQFKPAAPTARPVPAPSANRTDYPPLEPATP